MKFSHQGGACGGLKMTQLNPFTNSLGFSLKSDDFLKDIFVTMTTQLLISFKLLHLLCKFDNMWKIIPVMADYPYF